MLYYCVKHLNILLSRFLCLCAKQGSATTTTTTAAAAAAAATTSALH